MLELPQPLTNYCWDQIIQRDVDAALSEDLNGLNPDSDVTGQLLPANQRVSASLITREAGVLAGQNWFQQAFSTIDKAIDIQWNINDGESFKPKQTLATINGNARSILTSERTAMNFLQTLSATATQTAKMYHLIKDTSCGLLDTRKTLPGLRMAQKYAVHCGGGFNHRIGLYDRFLIKENHIMAADGIENAINKAHEINQIQGENSLSRLIIEVEVESLSELEKAINAGADIIMLDNFTPEQCREAVALRKQLYCSLPQAEDPSTLLRMTKIEMTGQSDIGQPQAEDPSTSLRMTGDGMTKEKNSAVMLSAASAESPAVILSAASAESKDLTRPTLPLLEASGNIDQQTILSYAQTGIDFISSGAITKNITAIDLSLRIDASGKR